MLVSLLAGAARCLDERLLHHPALVDLVAREVLDFPLGRGSLCRHLTGALVAELLGRAADFAHLLEPATLERARAFAQARRGFYR